MSTRRVTFGKYQMTSSLPDWLEDEGDPHEKEWTTFDELLALNLIGWRVDFGCRGGDMLGLEGIVDLIYKDGNSIMLRLKDVEIAPEDPEERAKIGIVEKRAVEIVELSTDLPPIIRDGLVLLGAGLADLPGYCLGAGLNQGFIFRK